MQQRLWIVHSVLCISKNEKLSEIQFIFISIYFHAMQVLNCLPLEFIMFSLTIVVFSMCDIVSYVCLGPVSFCTWEEYWPLINLSGSPRGYQQFNAVATPCCVDMADCHRCCCTYKWCDKSLSLKFNYSSSVQYTTHSMNWLFCWLSAINSLESFCSMNSDACWSNVNRLMTPVFKIKKTKAFR